MLDKPTMTLQLEGIACRRLHTPQMILDNVLIQFDSGRIGVMGDFNSAWIPPGYFNARDGELTVVPGLVDVHIHGGAGADFLDKAEESYRRISNSAARGGATSIVATTTIPIDDEQLEGFAEFVRLIRRVNDIETKGARFLGIFLEGPFINMEKRGGFGERFVQPVDLNKAERMLSICEDLLLKITVAPEIENAPELIELLLENPRTTVEVSLGHTSADFDLARRWFERDRVRQVTHAFNAMHPFHHRAPNLIGAAMLDEKVMMEIIPDGYHLTGPAVELLYRTKGHRRLMVITDGTAATGTDPGTRVRSVGGYTEVKDGAVRLMDGALAGSNLRMSDALAFTQRIGNVPFEHALEMCTLTPAASVNKQSEIGTIDPGKRADFCVLKKDGSVAATIRDGLLVYAA